MSPSPRCWHTATRTWASLALTAALSLPSFALATVPAAIQADGLLLSAGGGPVADGDYGLTFRLYADKTTATAAWKEGPFIVSIKGGQFSLALGAEVPLTPQALGSLNEVWLGVVVGNDPELPRKQLRSVPFSLRATTAENLDCSGCVGAGHLDPKLLSSLAKAADLAPLAQKAELADYAKVAALSPVAGSGDYNDLKNKPKNADVASSGAYADLIGLPVLAKVGSSCGSGLVVSGLKADGSLECVAGGVSAANLPADGLEKVSNGLFKNQFVDTLASSATPIAIPDFLAVGINDVITLGDYGAAVALQVAVSVSNSDIAKVRVDLYDPKGIKTTIYKGEKTGKKLDLLLDAPGNAALDGWIGQNPKGVWSLVVADLAASGVAQDGNLESWQIGIKTLSSKKVAATGLLQLMNSDAAPQPCTPTLYGAMFASPKDLAIYVCNAKVWVPIALAPVGTQDNPAASCKDILTKQPTSKDGEYYLKAGGVATKMTCDMTNAGGGWTLIALENTADAAGWSDGTLTNATVAGAGVSVHGMWGSGGGADKTFDLKGIPHSQTRVRARYYAIDSWDSEGNGAQVFLDGGMKWAKSKQYNSAGDAPGWVAATFSPAPWGNNSNQNGYWQVEADLGLVDHSATTLKVGIKTGIDQPASDESFAFSHVQVWIR